MMNVYPSRLSGLVLIWLFLLPISLLAQHFPEKVYRIASGQYLFSEKINPTQKYEPYTKEYFEVYGDERTKVIEQGDFFVQETLDDGVLKKDTLHFIISTKRITRGDTIRETELVEYRKRVLFPLEVRVKTKGDRLYITPTDNPKNSFFSLLDRDTLSDNSTPQEQYFFKLEKGERFELQSSSVAANWVTLPIRVRGNTAQARLNNVGLLFGLRSGRHIFDSGKLRHRHLHFGPYIGASVVRLDENNSNLDVGQEEDRFGFMFGFAIQGVFNKLSLGLGIGLESVNDASAIEWDQRGKVFFGFIAGYSLSDNF